MQPLIPLPSELNHIFGRIDIYLLDQILKGNIHPGMRILDAGCGGGRNLIYLMQLGAEIYGVDKDSSAVKACQALARKYASSTVESNFSVARIEEMDFPAETFDAVFCSAVLHFSKDESHFEQMLDKMWQCLRPEGIFFARLASDISMESEVSHIHGRWFYLPDGTERFLVNEEMILQATERLGGVLYEPIKTVRVGAKRCMTNWFMQKKK